MIEIAAEPHATDEQTLNSLHTNDLHPRFLCDRHVIARVRLSHLDVRNLPHKAARSSAGNYVRVHGTSGTPCTWFAYLAATNR